VRQITHDRKEGELVAYPRRFDHDECRRLRALDRKYWKLQRLADHFGVAKRSVERALNPVRDHANQRARYYRYRERILVAQAAWRSRNRIERNLSERCGIPIARARAILEAQARAPLQREGA
jgi:hypothetical protein